MYKNLRVNNESSIVSLLFRSFSLNKLSHALLFIGENFNEKKKLAISLCLKLSCKNLNKNIINELVECGSCSSCNSILRNNHRNIKFIDDDFKIDVIKKINNEFSFYGYEIGARVLIVSKAHKLTKSALNCLIKNLEEPNSECYIILFSPSENLLLPAIVSRCQKFFFNNSIEKYKINDTLVKDIFNKINDATVIKKLSLIDEMSKNKREILSFLNELAEFVLMRIKQNLSIIRIGRYLLDEIMNTEYKINNNANVRLSLENLFLKSWNIKL